MLVYIIYIVLGALIFGVLEKDFEVQQRHWAVKTKADFLKNRSDLTHEDVQIFVQIRREDVGILRLIVLLSLLSVWRSCLV